MWEFAMYCIYKNDFINILKVNARFISDKQQILIQIVLIWIINVVKTPII